MDVQARQLQSLALACHVSAACSMPGASVHCFNVAIRNARVCMRYSQSAGCSTSQAARGGGPHADGRTKRQYRRLRPVGAEADDRIQVVAAPRDNLLSSAST
jgi:hypothetical protein